MRRLIPALAVAFAMSLAGCAAVTSLETKAVSAVTGDLLTINTAIAKAEPTVAAFVTNHLVVAEGYFNAIAATGVLSPAVINEEASIVAQIAALNGKLPTSVAGVAALLANAFTDIQNLTTVQ